MPPHQQQGPSLFAPQDLALLKEVVDHVLQTRAHDIGAQAKAPNLAEALAALQIVQMEIGMQEESPVGKHVWTLVCTLARMPGETWLEKLAQASEATSPVDQSHDADDEEEEEAFYASSTGYRSESALRPSPRLRTKTTHRQGRHASGYATTNDAARPALAPARRTQARAGNKSVLSQKLDLEEAEHAQHRAQQHAHLRKEQQRVYPRASQRMQRSPPPKMIQPQPFTEPRISQKKQAELTRIYLDVENYKLGSLLHDALDCWRSRFRARMRKRQEERHRQHRQYQRAVQIDHRAITQLSFNIWYDAAMQSITVRRIQEQRANNCFADRFLYRWFLRTREVKRAQWLAQMAAKQEAKQAEFAARCTTRRLIAFTHAWRAQLEKKRVSCKQALRTYQRNVLTRSLQTWFCRACEHSLKVVRNDALACQTLQAWRIRKQVRDIALARVDAAREDSLLANAFELWQGQMATRSVNTQLADEIVAARFFARWQRLLNLHRYALPIRQEKDSQLALQALDKWRTVFSQRHAVAEIGQQAKLRCLFTLWRQEASCTQFQSRSNASLARRCFIQWQREALLRELQDEKDADMARRALHSWQDTVRSVSGVSGPTAQAEAWHRQRHGTSLQRATLHAWLIRLADLRAQFMQAEAVCDSGVASLALRNLYVRMNHIRAMTAQASRTDRQRTGFKTLKRWQTCARIKKQQAEEALVARFQQQRDDARRQNCLERWHKRAGIALALKAQCDAVIEGADKAAQLNILTRWLQAGMRRQAQFTEAVECDADVLFDRIVSRMEQKLLRYRNDCADIAAVRRQHDTALIERFWVQWQERHAILVEMQLKAAARAERLRRAHDRAAKHIRYRAFAWWRNRARTERGLGVIGIQQRVRSSGSRSGSANSSLAVRERSRLHDECKR